MPTNFKKIVGLEDPNLQSVQDNVRDVLQPFISNPFLDGVLLEDVTIVSGSNTIDHKLGREYRGYVLVSTGTAQTAGVTWTDFTPTLAGLGGMTLTVTRSDVNRYKVIGDTCFVESRNLFTLGGVADRYLSLNAPVPMRAPTTINDVPWAHATVDNGIRETGGVAINYSDGNILVTVANYTAWTLGANRLYAFSICYQVNDQYSVGTELAEEVSPDKTKFLKVKSNGRMNAKIYVF